jgi:hypothetical protein
MSVQEQHQQTLQAMGVDTTNIDWSKIVPVVAALAELLKTIFLSKNNQPVMQAAFAGCDPAEQEDCCCLVEATHHSLETTRILLNEVHSKVTG